MTTTYEIVVNKADVTIPVEWDKLPPASQQQVIQYGLKQLLNDATASVKPDEEGSAEKAKTAATERLNRLVAGTYKTGAGRGAKLSPEEQALREVLMMVYQKQLTKADAKALAEQGWEGLRERNPDQFETNKGKLMPHVEKRAKEIRDAASVQALGLSL